MGEKHSKEQIMYYARNIGSVRTVCLSISLLLTVAAIGCDIADVPTDSGRHTPIGDSVSEVLKVRRRCRVPVMFEPINGEMLLSATSRPSIEPIELCVVGHTMRIPSNVAKVIVRPQPISGRYLLKIRSEQSFIWHVAKGTGNTTEQSGPSSFMAAPLFYLSLGELIPVPLSPATSEINLVSEAAGEKTYGVVMGMKDGLKLTVSFWHFGSNGPAHQHLSLGEGQEYWEDYVKAISRHGYSDAEIARAFENVKQELLAMSPEALFILGNAADTRKITNKSTLKDICRYLWLCSIYGNSEEEDSASVCICRGTKVYAVVAAFGVCRVTAFGDNERFLWETGGTVPNKAYSPYDVARAAIAIMGQYQFKADGD
jgi:hypothetical protein